MTIRNVQQQWTRRYGGAFEYVCISLSYSTDEIYLLFRFLFLGAEIPSWTMIPKDDSTI